MPTHYSTDHSGACDFRRAQSTKGFDEQLQTDERKFLYMPFVHSEDLDDQNLALLLFTEINDEEQIGYAKKHRDIIARFGRFPHRNAATSVGPLAAEEPRPSGDAGPF